MKNLIFLIFLLPFLVKGQTVTTISTADTSKFRRTTGTTNAEAIIANGDRNVSHGIAYNAAGGWLRYATVGNGLSFSSNTFKADTSILRTVLNSYSKANADARFVPLTAGSTKPLTGDLYVTNSGNTSYSVMSAGDTGGGVFGEAGVLFRTGTTNKWSVFKANSGDNEDLLISNYVLGTTSFRISLLTDAVTLAGSLGVTGTRISKGWFTDLEVTNAIVGGVTGNAGTATKLATARTIGILTGDVTSSGSSFDGSGNNTNSVTVTKINGTSLAGLGTGILKNTTSTGVPSIAVAADFPTLNQNTTGSAATLTTTRTIWGQNFNGSANVTGALSGATDITATGQIFASGTGTSTGFTWNNFNVYQDGSTILHWRASGTDYQTVNSSGAVTFSNTLGIGGTADNVKGSTYTPTKSGETNIASLTVNQFIYSRVGSVVTGSGDITITPTATGSVQFKLTLPSGSASNFASTEDANGNVSLGNQTGVGAVWADPTNDLLFVNYTASSTSLSTIKVMFQYIIK